MATVSRKCTVCKEEITLVDKSNVPQYYKIVDKAYNWYCGPVCGCKHHEVSYRPIKEEVENRLWMTLQRLDLWGEIVWEVDRWVLR